MKNEIAPAGQTLSSNIDDNPYLWLSRNGHMEARLFHESVEEVLFFFRRIGTDGRGVAKTMTKEGFQQSYSLRPAA